MNCLMPHFKNIIKAQVALRFFYFNIMLLI